VRVTVRTGAGAGLGGLRCSSLAEAPGIRSRLGWGTGGGGSLGVSLCSSTFGEGLDLERRRCCGIALTRGAGMVPGRVPGGSRGDGASGGAGG